ncbi:MAG: hypothetical protein V3S59_06010, partial [Alphaproteobacteria bacterium]
ALGPLVSGPRPLGTARALAFAVVHDRLSLRRQRPRGNAAGRIIQAVLRPRGRYGILRHPRAAVAQG